MSPLGRPVLLDAIKKKKWYIKFHSNSYEDNLGWLLGRGSI